MAMHHEQNRIFKKIKLAFTERLIRPKQEVSDLEHLPEYLRSYLYECRKIKKDTSLQQDIIDTLFIDELRDVATEEMIEMLGAYNDIFMAKSFLIKIGMEKMNNLVEKMITRLRANQYDERLLLLQEKKRQMEQIQ